MSYTKGEIIAQAFVEIGLPPYIFEIQPEQEQVALQRLDMMIAEWDRRGIRFGYPLAESPTDSSLDDDSGIPDTAILGTVLNLAIQLAPSYGKAVPVETKVAAYNALQSLMTSAAQPMEYQWPSTTPYGAGNKPWRVANWQFVGKRQDKTVQPARPNINFSPENGS